MVALFVFFGFFASRIHLEEDLNKLMPSSKNPDGTTKLAFSSLRVKDKTYILFHGRKGTSPEKIAAVCDAFIDSLQAANNRLGKGQSVFSDIFYTITDDDLMNGVDYMEHHFPAYIDTTLYSHVDTMLTVSHFQRQMAQNVSDMEGSFGENFPELIQMDPVGLRTELLREMVPSSSKGNDVKSKGPQGGYRIINSHIFVPDSTVCLALITPRATSFNTGGTTKLFEMLNTEIAKFEKSHPDVAVSYHGTPASGYYNSSTIKHDLTTTLLGSLVLVMLFIFFCYRNWDTLPLLLLPVVFGTLFGLAMMYFIKGEFSLLALGIGAIVLGVAMSYVLHILTHYKYVTDPEQVLRDEVKSVSLGCITTIGSFVGLIFIQNELLRDFGLFASFAILGTTAFSLTYLPQLLDTKVNRINRKAFALIDRINNYPFDRNRPLIITICVITVICIGAYLLHGIHFDANLDNLGYKSAKVSGSSALLREKTAGDHRSTTFASSGKTMEEAIANFGVLRAKLDSLKHLGLVAGYTPTDRIFVPLDIQQRRIKAWKAFWTPERQARVRGLIAATAPSEGFESDAFDPFFESVNADYAPDKLYAANVVPKGFQSMLMERTYGGQYLCFTSVSYNKAEKDNGGYKRICDAVAKNPSLLVLDTAYYTTDNLMKLNSDFNVLQWVSMAFVFVVLLLSFHGNWRYTLLGFMPIVLSWLIVLGAMDLFGMQFNLINIIISTFIFGIGVDYSIFVMNGLIGQKENDHLLAYHKTAILFSAIVLVVTVGSMLFAQHPAIRSVGFATLVGLLSAVVLAYVLQPAIYRALHLDRPAGSLAARA